MITPTCIIQKKRDGHELTPDEICGFIRGVCDGTVADYQASAFLMAVYFRGMSLTETVALTEAMLDSGERYDLSLIPGAKVDKHSTGGVGDKVSLILAPLAAACGLKVPMMSGRGLGHSGGTLDKLESVAGFRVNLNRIEFEHTLGKVGCAMIGQSERMVPADKKLYALRDVTGTVECVPLITASILSKKLAEGSNALVLDVKVGSGAFMKTREQARKLAKTLIQVARRMKLPCRALLTNMDQPLGYAVGNSLEVIECMQVLKNEKIPGLSSVDLKELTIQLCAHMLELGGIARNLTEGRKISRARLADGSAWKIFQEMIRSQGGSLAKIEQGHADLTCTEWKSTKKGFVSEMDAEVIGRILVELGGGRKKASDTVDPTVGLVFHKKLGSRVQAGDPLVTVYSRNGTDLTPLETLFHQSLDIVNIRKPVPELILEQY